MPVIDTIDGDVSRMLSHCLIQYTLDLELIALLEKLDTSCAYLKECTVLTLSAQRSEYAEHSVANIHSW